MKYWREIIICGLIAMLFWIGPKSTIKTIGSSDTICYRDTIYNRIPVPTRGGVKRVYIDRTDSIYIVKMDVDTVTVMDTSWLYADIPLQIYEEDSVYYIRTVGWLDSIDISPRYWQGKLDIRDQNTNFSFWGNLQMGKNNLAPGIWLQNGRYQLGLNYNLYYPGVLLSGGYRIY